MSHRKRVRAYWNKRAAEKRHAELFAALNGHFKATYAPRQVLVSEWSQLAHLFTWEGRLAMLRSIR